MRQLDSVGATAHAECMRQTVSKMKYAVLGATGGTGRHVVATALARGHDVVALIRRPAMVEPAPRLREVLWKDLRDPSALVDAFREVDVVISALGGAGKGPTTVCTDAMRSTIEAMTRVGVPRLIAVSAYGVADTRNASLFSRAVWAGVGNKMRDKETMEPLIVGSGLNWTIVRPPKLTDRLETGHYDTGVDLPIRLWSSVGRADLAGFLVREAEDPQFERQFPRITG
jgi:putative NADH-flavin reductase